MKTTLLLATGLAFAGVAAACNSTPPVATGIYGNLGDISPTATDDQRATFQRGKTVALHRYTQAEGLGSPTYNVTFCVACHERPVTGGSAGRYRNFLLLGQELSDQSFTAVGVNGVLDHFTLDPITRNPTPSTANVIASRNPIPFFGVGLIAELPDSEILKNADPNDDNHDGIRGRPNYDRGFVGRFGRKSQTVSVEGFIRGPLFNHLGITSNPLTDADRARLPVPVPVFTDAGSSSSNSIAPQTGEPIGTQQQAQAAAPDAPTTDTDGVPDPEISEQDLFDLISFAMLLAAPQPDAPTAASEAGRALFEKINCTGCHVSGIAGPRGLVPLFSDLLVHDMGPDLADGIVMKTATGADFRTQPLWGIGAEGPYLHDGRADTIDDAIRMHGGEAQAARDAYVALGADDQGSVREFLLSLGGRSQTSTGLLPPNAPVVDVGAYGGPVSALDGDALAQFTAGRAVFDRDVPLSAGLGPQFNGDSCRACHFDPVIGGAGPDDVNVIRQGKLDSGTFTAPASGTMLHRLAVSFVTRPEPDPICNLFEERQPPPLFGLGLVDRIPDAQILAREDPDDADGDGIRGRAFRLDDGRIGRFGWKANVPSLPEFVRDAMSNELGLTVPASSSLTFGSTSDSDSTPDPEISQADLDAALAFVAALGPPPRTSTNPNAETAGGFVFVSTGCAKCHTLTMTTTDNVTVPLYSDLLLHDVSPPGTPGIVEGVAGMNDFRTAPLWGLATTGPYMHDGRAFTIESAILAHDGEALAIRQRFSALSPSDHDSLLAFLSSL